MPRLVSSPTARAHGVACGPCANGLNAQFVPCTVTGLRCIAAASSGFAAEAIQWNRGNMRMIVSI